MKRLWMMILLSCTASLGAIEKADFTLKWLAERNQATDPIELLQDRDNKWGQSPSSLSMQEQKPRRPHIFDRVDKAHRLGFIDPNFSSFNSDDGYSGYAKSDRK